MRRLVNEDYTRGVPDFAVGQATERYVRELRQHLMRYVLSNAALSDVDKRESIGLANRALEDVEEEIGAMVQDRLTAFMRQV